MTVTLKTGRYTTHRPEYGVAVATSLGRPKWPLSYEIAAVVRDLMPFGLLGLPDDEFRRRYLDRLDAIGPDRLRTQFEAISAQHPGQPLVLLCWENALAGEMCHRRLAAEWLEAHGFGQVPECQPDPPAQTTLDLIPTKDWIPVPVWDFTDDRPAPQYMSEDEPPEYIEDEWEGTPIRLLPKEEGDRLMRELYGLPEPAQNYDTPTSGQLPEEER